MKGKFHAQVSKGEEKKNLDFADPDMGQVSQVFHEMFGDAFPTSKATIPAGFLPCPHCEGTGRVIKVKKHLLGTSKNVTKDPCPHCEGKGYMSVEKP